MEATHVHLLLNHFPIIGTLIGAAVMLWGMVRHDKSIKTVAAVIIVTMTCIAVPVYLTGEPAQKRVEHILGVSEAMIEEHKEAAEVAMVLLAVAGLASLAALLLQYRTGSKIPYVLAFILSVFAFAAMTWAGYYGGQIRHSELRQTQQPFQQIEENKHPQQK